MKHVHLASALALVLGLAAATSASAAASSGGTITFTGAVTDATCTVKGGAGTNGGTDNFTVALDSVDAAKLATAGQTANPKLFDVIIGGEGQGTCVDGKVAKMTFLISSPQIDPATGALVNALAGEATNVQIQLQNGKKKVIDLADPSNGETAKIKNNTATIPYSAQYLAVNGAATPGLVSTSVVYSVSYN
jgi:major type 1 subunit fimbrin (pilin)